MEPNTILSESLSLSSDIPLYAQLVGIIKRSISSGALAIGDLLPSEDSGKTFLQVLGVRIELENADEKFLWKKHPV